jgi:hypothetical protein
LRDLVACGQATTCANLLGYLYERCLPALTDPDSVESRVVATLTPLWEQMQAQPHALLEAVEVDRRFVAGAREGIKEIFAPVPRTCPRGVRTWRKSSRRNRVESECGARSQNAVKVVTTDRVELPF